MPNIIYVKQHSVFSTDKLSGKTWREEKQVNWLCQKGYRVLWVSSDFDHYGKIRRVFSPIIKGVKIKFLSTFAYRKNVTLTRLLGNWQFSVKLLLLLIKERKKTDNIFCAYPTPESALICVLFSKVANVPLVLDIRDNWPEAILAIPNSLTGRLFALYCSQLNKIIFKLQDNYIGMSDGVLRKVKRDSQNTKKKSISFTQYI